MKNLRRQTKLISSLAETVLQYRLNPYTGLSEHIIQIRKKIRTMINTESYEDGITEMLVSKQNYQIRNKINKYENELINKKSEQIWVQIRISAIEKQSCQKYNSELWQFGIKFDQYYKQGKSNNSSAVIIQLIQYVLRYLMCYSLLPLNKQQRNKYMLDHKVTITNQYEAGNVVQFGNTSKQQLVLSMAQNQKNCKIQVQYSYNQRKIQQSLKQIIVSKSFYNSQNSKKNSMDTMDSYRRVSLYQYYDDQLDITVLSGSDSDGGQQIELDLENIEQQDQFQILIEQTASQDELFLRNNLNLFKDLNIHLNGYL